MIRIAIVDDELESIKKLSEFVAFSIHSIFKSDVAFKITSFQSGEKLLSAMASDKNFDIIFLDIQMARIDGIETAQRLRIYNKKVVIIYVSSFGNRITESMTVHPFAFIQKPYTKQDIMNVFREYLDYYMNFETTSETMFIFDADNIHIEVSENDIVSFQYIANRKIKLDTLNNGTLELKASISSIYEQLDKKIFLMPNSGNIINAYNVERIDGKNLILIMNNESRINISRRRYKDIIMSIGFIRKQGGK